MAKEKKLKPESTHHAAEHKKPAVHEEAKKAEVEVEDQKPVEKTAEEPAKKETVKHSKKAYVIFGIIIGVLVLIFISQFFLRSNPTGDTTTTTYTNNGVEGQYDALAKCLTQKGAVFYGAGWCPHCSAQKEMFGSSMQYVNYVQCQGASRSDPFPQACIDANIEAFPTWIINGKQYLGSQTAQVLADTAGCTI